MSEHHALIVDDEPDIRELLAITLGRMDVACSAAANISEARALLERNAFDLCLTDMSCRTAMGSIWSRTSRAAFPASRSR